MSLESSRVSQSYFPHINLLRGFAAMTVLIYHVIELGGWDAFPRDYPLRWFRHGWMAVDLFFVISGFVIGWSLLKMREKEPRFGRLSKHFIIRRFGRIAPLYFVTCIAYVVIVTPQMANYPLGWFHFLTHATFIHPLFSKTFGSINGANWSVGIEVHFYLFALASFALWRRMRPFTAILTAFLVAWLLRSIATYWAVQSGVNEVIIFQKTTQMPMMLDEFGIGLVLALLFTQFNINQLNNKRRKHYALLSLLAFIVSFVFAIGIFLPYGTYWDFPLMVIFWRSLLAISFGFLLLTAIFWPISSRAKPTIFYRIFYYLGDISYGVYLWHLIVIWVLNKYYDLSAPELLIATSVSVLMLSAMSWHWIEKPCVRLSKKWTQNKR